jgi:hypothetical protein
MTDRTLCNCMAWVKGLDPVGYAAPIQRLLALEVGLPWKRTVLDSLPRALQSVLERAKVMGGNIINAMGLSQLLLIAPDQHGTVFNRRRALVWERPSAPFARFTRREYLLPEEVLTDFGCAMSFRPEYLPQFDCYVVNEGHSLQDFLVCTHGSRDVACGRFGYRLYDRLIRLTASNPQVRIWRASHFGGHVFAPTMVELPSGIFWGNLYDDRAEQIVERRGDVAHARAHYRGWSGAARGFAQAAEREMLLSEGWHWLDTARTVQVTAQDPAERPQWAEVQLACNKEGNPHLYTAHVAVSHHIETIANTGHTIPHPFAQYVVTQLGG